MIVAEKWKDLYYANIRARICWALKIGCLHLDSVGFQNPTTPSDLPCKILPRFSFESRVYGGTTFRMFPSITNRPKELSGDEAMLLVCALAAL